MRLSITVNKGMKTGCHGRRFSKADAPRRHVTKWSRVSAAACLLRWTPRNRTNTGHRGFVSFSLRFVSGTPSLPTRRVLLRAPGGCAAGSRARVGAARAPHSRGSREPRPIFSVSSFSSFVLPRKPWGETPGSAVGSPRPLGRAEDRRAPGCARPQRAQLVPKNPGAKYQGTSRRASSPRNKTICAVNLN